MSLPATPTVFLRVVERQTTLKPKKKPVKFTGLK